MLKRFRVGQNVVGKLGLCRLGARFNHVRENLALLLCEAFDRFHQIGNEVGPALILVQHLAPRCLGHLIEGWNIVDAAPRNESAQQCDHRESGKPGQVHTKVC